VKEGVVPDLAGGTTPSRGCTRGSRRSTRGLRHREDACEDVGTVPVPPKYGQADFADKASWRLRGKLDVPKGRFVAYPGLAATPTPRDLDSARALASTYEQRRSVDGWSAERLAPILAGLAELVPWLRQWHNNVRPRHRTAGRGLPPARTVGRRRQGRTSVRPLPAGEMD
jgi:hypothetical protein